MATKKRKKKARPSASNYTQNKANASGSTRGA